MSTPLLTCVASSQQHTTKACARPSIVNYRWASFLFLLRKRTIGNEVFCCCAIVVFLSPSFLLSFSHTVLTFDFPKISYAFVNGRVSGAALKADLGPDIKRTTEDEWMDGIFQKGKGPPTKRQSQPGHDVEVSDEHFHSAIQLPPPHRLGCLFRGSLNSTFMQVSE
ncbi:hypothetical protein BKA57DRAFT_63836 [Linnemannia elongata]|nr:hypothetical protein BKA57DRAFT_63836 [Linnemannia elongata]